MITKSEQILQLSAPYDNPYQGSSHRAVFVCSAGLLRSATAATIGSSLGMNTRACGSESYALIPLSLNLLFWAHTIYFVSEYNYLGAQETFCRDTDAQLLLDRKSVIWDIPDVYDYMQPQLVKIITELLS